MDEENGSQSGGKKEKGKCGRAAPVRAHTFPSPLPAQADDAARRGKRRARARQGETSVRSGKREEAP